MQILLNIVLSAIIQSTSCDSLFASSFTAVIANIYRNRWQIESFFKWIKGNLTITEVSKVVGASLLTKTDLRELLDAPATLTQNQNVNELELNF